MLNNVVAGIARVEQDHGPAYLAKMVEQFAEWLDESGQSGLRRDVLAWLSKVVLPGRVSSAEVPELQDLEEFQTYLEVNMQTWTEQWRAEGRDEGLRIGREEGVRLGREEGRQKWTRQGEAAVLLRQLEFKFGPLDAVSKARIQAADTDQLLRWAESLLTTKSLADLFGD